MSFYKNISHSDKHINSLLNSLFKYHPKEISLSLKRINKLLKKLNNPHLKIPKVIHIAGTNGKGSVATILFNLQKRFGRKVHVYRSPHLNKFNERIFVSNKMITNNYLAEILQHIKEVNKKSPITFFEITTAAAFFAFSENKADLVVLEVGLGGRYDATNIIHKKECSILTPIGMDHREYLGNSLKKIANEKSAIIGRKNLVICSKQKKHVNDLIKKVSIKKECNGYFYNENWSIKNERLIFDDNEIDLSKISLHGIHQYFNAACAIIASKKISGLEVKDSNIYKTLSNIQWKGRLHKLKGKICLRYPSLDMWVDCAHNSLGFDSLLMWIKKQKLNDIVIILALGINKDYKRILKKLKLINPLMIFFVKETKFNVQDPKLLKSTADSLNINSQICSNMFECLKNSNNLLKRKSNSNVIITGSIYLVASALLLEKK